jgi:acyl-coenzyme A thioesterase PaaI-like protein
MKQRVVGKQENCSDCMVCGLENEFGLKASFFELENGEVVAIFKPQEKHQSYPGRLHGGMAAAVLDETIGRAMKIKDRNIWSVTVELRMRYKKPIPLNEEVKAVGRITKDSSRLFEGTGEILLSNGDVAVSAFGKYMKMPLGKIADSVRLQWQVRVSDSDPKEITV